VFVYLGLGMKGQGIKNPLTPGITGKLEQAMPVQDQAPSPVICLKVNYYNNNNNYNNHVQQMRFLQ